MRINLGSTRLAFFLIAVLLVFIVLSAIIPQQDIASGQIIDLRETLGDFYIVVETLQLDGIYTAPYFFVTLGLLILNLVVGNVRRFRAVYKTERTLVRTRHLGSITFHLSIVLIMLAIVLNYLFRFSGVFALSEGQSAQESDDGYFRTFAGPLHAHEFGTYTIRLDSIDLNYPVDDAFTEAAFVSLTETGRDTAASAVIRVNRPHEWLENEFHIGGTLGYSPELVVKDSAGETLFKSFVRLASRTEGDQTRYQDFVLLDDGAMKIEIEVIPVEGVVDATRCRLAVYHDGILARSQELGRTDSLWVAGYQFKLPRLRRWCYIEVAKSPFLGLVFLGFWTGLIGMAVGFGSRLAQQRK